ncbi:hypothetical protein NBM05_08385 [Rothia sp. AR01]|uniref:Portal protein n=1 Tax=Rothia santali TaxID=2949643 RepID=A0A9X2HJH1_9MICC|nr:hypothetical protein [Rothia santali]MCP3426018.1 hypothetical protein [Rothia santali]
MGILHALRETASRAADAALARRLGYAPGERRQLLDQLELVQESVADLELAREDTGWAQLTGPGAREFPAAVRRANAEVGRALAIANPLIKRGLAIRASFVWGQGVGITAEATGEHGAQDVNDVVQRFLDDPGNRVAYTGHQAHLDAETALGTDGNRFLAHFTDPRTGAVKVRAIPFDEVEEIIANPEDSTEPWYYLRRWTQRNVTAGQTSTTEHVAYYPALGYAPVVRHKRIDGIRVVWEAPVYHVRDNGLADWQWGVGDVYASIPWVRAYKRYLEDWANYMSALARITYRISGKDRQATQAARGAIQEAMRAGVAGGAIAAANADIEAIPKAGATIDAESGKPLAVMVSAGLSVPITLLLGDPGATGARAVAETLTQPMIYEFQSRRELWTEALRASLNYVVDMAVIAPAGPLQGTVAREGDRRVVTLAGDTPRTLTIEWPRLDELGEREAIEAIIAADATEKIPPEVTARLLLRALRVRDVDEIVESMLDDDGVFVPPGASIGDELLRRYEQGRFGTGPGRGRTAPGQAGTGPGRFGTGSEGSGTTRDRVGTAPGSAEHRRATEAASEGRTP